MARIIGDSFSGLQGTAYNYDALNASIQQKQADQAAAQYQFGVQTALAQQRQQEEDARQSVDQMFRRQQANQSLDAQTRAENNAAYQFGATQAARAAENTTKHQEYEEGLDLTKQLGEDKEGQRAEEKTQTQKYQDFQTALQLINSGLLKKDAVDKDYAHLEDYQRQTLKDAAEAADEMIATKKNAGIQSAADFAAALPPGPKPALKDATALAARGVAWNPATSNYFAMRGQAPVVAPVAVPASPAVTMGAAPLGGMVNVIRPDGAPGQIPAANVDRALARGYKLAQ